MTSLKVQLGSGEANNSSKARFFIPFAGSCIVKFLRFKNGVKINSKSDFDLFPAWSVTSTSILFTPKSEQSKLDLDRVILSNLTSSEVPSSRSSKSIVNF